MEFTKIDDGMMIYNLEFGDLDLMTGKADDSVKPNNGDRGLLMATVAAIVLEFITRYPDKFVFAEGFNRARTRLYQRL